VSTFASEHVVQVSSWTELPREIIEIVLQDLPQNGLWTCRNVSSRWAAATKASGLLKLVTSLYPSAWNEARFKLSKLHLLGICDSQVQCCLNVELPDTAACAAVLEPLTEQVTLTDSQLHLLTMNSALRSCCQTNL